MLAAASGSDFLRDPYGRYFVGRRFIIYAHSPTLIGLDPLGSPTVEDIRELLALAEIEKRLDAPPHYSIIDVRHCDTFDPAAFALAIQWVIKARDIFAEKIARAIMLRPSLGMLGAAVAGFSRVTGLRNPWQAVESEEEAIQSLGIDPVFGRALFAEVDAIRESVLEDQPIVRKLRELFARDGALSAEGAARALAYSTRSLQRALGRAGTTYRHELTAYRMNRAKLLLGDEDRTLAAIAADIGFASVPRFVTAFHSSVGMTPHAWRIRYRTSKMGP